MSGVEYPWAEPPGRGEVRPVAPGVAWARMPLPFRLDHINVYLLDDGDTLTVVDTGIGLPETRSLWERVLAEAGGGRPVSRLVVTHFHPDHMGNAGWFTAREPATVTMTLGEWFATQHAWRSREAHDLDLRLAHYRRHGLDEEGLGRLRERGNHYPGVVPTLPTGFRRLRDGDGLPVGGREWEVRVGEGHSPEHACLYSPAAGVLVSGDQILPKITTNVSVWAEEPAGNPLRLYLDSLDRFQGIGPEVLVLPSHGLPFRGLPGRLAALRDHHARRLAEAVDALREPRTAAELVPLLFRRELDTHQLAFAMGEALAHLNFLEAEGRVVRLVGRDGVHRFRKA